MKKIIRRATSLIVVVLCSLLFVRGLVAAVRTGHVGWLLSDIVGLIVVLIIVGFFIWRQVGIIASGVEPSAVRRVALLWQPSAEGLLVVLAVAQAGVGELPAGSGTMDHLAALGVLAIASTGLAFNIRNAIVLGRD